VSDEPQKLADQPARADGSDAEAPGPQDDVRHRQEPAAAVPGEAGEAGEAPAVPAEEGAHREIDPQQLPEAKPAEAAVEEAGGDDDLDGPYEEEPEDDSDVDPIEEAGNDDEDIQMDWYILKVQSNRERSIAASLQRKVAIEGLENYFGEIVVPTEKVTEFKGGKKKIVERKLYPGYIVVQMHINDDTWFAVRETSGIGDFTGAGGKPTPMLPQEVARIVQGEEEETEEAPKLDIKFKLEDKVKVKEGTFEGFEGDVNAIDEQSGKITVMINIFGRSTPVELEYWQVEGV
jgi:transcriptional antiterminator NusG